MMTTLLTKLAEASESGPSIHITPEGLFEIGGLTITNSMAYGLVSSTIIVLFLIYVANKMTIRPKKGVVQLVEIASEFVFSTVQGALGSRKLAVKYAPYFTAAFFFVMLSNWLGLIPGVGEALTLNETPVLRPFTADLNGTIAASLVMMVLVQIFAIKETGFHNYVRHFFAGSLKNPATYLLGFFEIFSEIIRVFSLALRLFLNVAIGEIIIAIFTYLGSFLAPVTALPFVMLELFVGALQAYIFTMLTIMYLGAAIKHDHEREEHVQIEESRTAAA
jgi:F-type H+-transporting ATPase subunit a